MTIPRRCTVSIRDGLTLFCGGLPATITGTADGDELRGTPACTVGGAARSWSRPSWVDPVTT
jgi:hypothetical protein